MRRASKVEPVKLTKAIKICFIGPQCGKSSLITRVLHDTFDDKSFDPTIEDHYYTSIEFEGTNYDIEILDTSGNESYSSLYGKWSLWGHGFFLVYSVTSANSFDMVQYFKEIIEQNRVKAAIFPPPSIVPIPLFLIGTQNDKTTNRQVIDKEGRSLALKYGCLFEEVSAKNSTQKQLKSMLSKLVGLILHYNKEIVAESIKIANDEKRRKELNIKSESISKDLLSVTLSRPAREGILEMTTKENFKKWKKYWTALEDGVLYLFSSEKNWKSGSPCLAESLNSCLCREYVLEEKQADKFHYFELVSLTEQYYFRTTSTEIRSDWVNAIQYHINLELSRLSIIKDTALKDSNSEEKDKYSEFVEFLQNNPANRLCAECNATKPDWILNPFGALVCLQCASIHRSLDVSVTSLALDNIPEEILITLKAIGNEKFNKIWEHRLQSSSVIKPGPKFSRKDKLEWIQTKYRDRKFLAKEIIEVKEEWDLLELLENSYGIKYFREFLNSEFSTENLDFYLEIEERKQVNSEDLLASKAQEICTKYVVEGSPHSVNLPGSIQKALLINLDTQAASSKKFFSKAQDHVLKVLSNDSWRRFLESDYCNNFMKELETEERGKKLMKAVRDGNAYEALYWIVQGASPNWKDANSKETLSVLHEACIFGEISCVALLLANGADVNEADSSNHTALYHAKRNKFFDIVELLAKKIHENSLSLHNLTIERQKPRKNVVFAQQLVKFDSKRSLYATKPVERRPSNNKKHPPEELKWTISKNFFDKSVLEFKKLDESKNYLLSSKISKTIVSDSYFSDLFKKIVEVLNTIFFDRYALSRELKERIFKLADLNNDKKFDLIEFVIAHSLCENVTKGIKVPDAVKADAFSELENVTLFPNGDKYLGNFNSSSEYEGEGIYFYANGSVFEGNFQNGQSNGEGTFVGPEGKYIGHFRNDKFEGKGTLFYSNGDKYEGSFLEGERHGAGVFTEASGNQYVGNFQCGQFHGKGEYNYQNGDRFVGTFHNGEYNIGTYYFSNGDKYKGPFSGGKPEGFGLFLYQNGDKYEGFVRAGVREGKGVGTMHDGTVYSGYYVNDVPHGIGHYQHNDFSYEGDFKRGKPDGFGKFQSNSGLNYEGNFKDFEFDGFGKCVYPDGTIYEGQFKNGKRNGLGKIIHAQGHIVEGRFENDVFKPAKLSRKISIEELDD